MKKKFYTLKEAAQLDKPLSGIYKINFPNGKSYIGLTNNMLKRMYSHNECDYKLKRVVGYAIHKYGPISEFEVLEEIDPEDKELMNIREKYWIAYYHTWTKDPLCKGYNMTEGGDGGNTLKGVDNPNSSFTQIKLDYIYNELLYNKERSMADIANEFNVSNDTIRNINRGITYVKEGIKYPIRTIVESNKNLNTGVKSTSAKLTEEQINKIWDLIQHSSLTFTDIGKKFNISNSTVGLINKGKRYHNDNFNYPLRDRDTVKQYQYQ